MKSASNFCRDAWRESVGLEPLSGPDDDVVSACKGKYISYEALRESERVSDLFLHLMNCNLQMGFFAYQPMADKYKDEHQYDYVKFIQDRLDAYKETHNTEFLVDVSNGGFLEFQFGRHPDKHYKAGDANIERATKIKVK